MNWNNNKFLPLLWQFLLIPSRWALLHGVSSFMLMDFVSFSHLFKADINMLAEHFQLFLLMQTIKRLKCTHNVRPSEYSTFKKTNVSFDTALLFTVFISKVNFSDQMIIYKQLYFFIIQIINKKK
jgi:hypothetical protein